MPSLAARLRRHATYANVTATLALFLVVSGGTAYAAATLIDGKNLRNESVTGAKVRNGSLGASDLSAAARKSLAGTDGRDGANGNDGADGAPGSQGAKGDKGDAGERGPAGAAGATGAQGPQGLPGASGIASVNDLNGKPCTHPDGSTGTVTLTVGAYSGDSITMVCTGGTPTPPPTDATPADSFEANNSMGSATLLPATGWPRADVTNDHFKEIGMFAGGPSAPYLSLPEGDVDWFRWNAPCDTGMPGNITAKAALVGTSYSGSNTLPVTMYDATGDVVPQGTAYCSGKSTSTPLYFKVTDTGIGWTWPGFVSGSPTSGRHYGLFIHAQGWT